MTGSCPPCHCLWRGRYGAAVCHRPALGVPPLIAGPWGAEWGPQWGAKTLCATGPVPCQALETPILMDVGYLGVSLTWNPPPPSVLALHDPGVVGDVVPSLGRDDR